MANDDRLEHAKVMKRLNYAEGNLIGRKNANPIMDTSMYKVTFPTGEANNMQQM
jgi:hypothetical protein